MATSNQASRPSYDDRQINAPLVTCPTCSKQAYMTHGGPLCAACTIAALQTRVRQLEAQLAFTQHLINGEED